MAKPVRRVKLPAKPKTVRTRTRISSEGTAATAKKPAAAKASSKRKAEAFDRGEDGFRKAAARRERQDAEYERRKNTPFDFRLAPGDEAEVVILDSEPPFFVTEHSLKVGGRWTKDVCLEPTAESCPLCQSLGKEGSYTMYLTVLDRRPYTIKKGPNAGKTIKVSKKLFPVKGRNLPKFDRQYRKFKERGGLWRGLRILCRRDGDKESGIGEDLEFLGFVKDSVLAKYGEAAVPAEYSEIFQVPSAAELVRRYNLKADGGVAGSEEFAEDDEETDLEKVGW